MAWLHAHVNDYQEALTLLKQCPLDEGFDPSGVERFKPLETNPEFRALVDRAHRRYPRVHQARVAFTVRKSDLFPEGLAADAETHVFYLGSMHLGTIFKITEQGAFSPFVRSSGDDLMPVGGVHVDPADHSVWAATDPGIRNRSEIVHFDSQGTLLERFTAPGAGPHDLNDLALRGSRELYVSDTDADQVYRFDRSTHRFSPLVFPRPLFYPNGITLSDDLNVLYVGDMLGVLRVDLRNDEAQDVTVDGHFTLAGIDGLYWYRGGLVGVQYGAGAHRVVQWMLSADGKTVTSAKMLEYRTPLVKDPTTGAVVGTKFYFISNTGISNLDGDGRIIDARKLEPIQVSVVTLK
ncbi:MAG TPA: hypothetical protein VGY48_33905 [Vicinamibacterales bacterium]|jgi:sugar lactone lactonase YvrE|nr:hypothetical protein [Vicinamibacterales bacterium]